MKYVWTGLIVLCTAVLYGSFLPAVIPPGFVPDLLLAITVSFAFYRGVVFGGIVGLACGLLLDLLIEPQLLGANALVYLLFGMAAGTLEQAGMLDRFVTPSVLVGLAFLVKQCIFAAVAAVLRIEMNFWQLLLQRMLPGALITAVCMPLAQWGIGKMDAAWRRTRNITKFW